MELKKFSVESHQGPFLNINEDGFDFSLNDELFMIFDGYGGSGIGDTALIKLKENLNKFFHNFISDRDATMPFYFSPKYLLEGNALINSALFSHFEMYKENMKKDVSERAGASGIMAIKSESIISLLSVGNCRAYILRHGKIQSLFSDDSFQYLSHDRFDSHFKNIPLSGFGLFPDLHYQLKEVRITKGDKLLLITDGVYGRIDDDELEAGMSRPSIDLKNKIFELFSLANSRGNLDNQTCMILEF